MNYVLSLINWSNNFVQATFLLDRGKTWDHLIDASIMTIEYLNGPHDGCISLHISPCTLSKKLGDSPAILLS